MSKRRKYEPETYVIAIDDNYNTHWYVKDNIWKMTKDPLEAKRFNNYGDCKSFILNNKDILKKIYKQGLGFAPAKLCPIYSLSSVIKF